MSAIKTKYSPSANIERDLNVPLAYVPTPNTKQIFKQIITEFENGNRAFNIIGSYGTGKSSFLLAFFQTLNKKHDFFPESTKLTTAFGTVTFIEIVGDYTSITRTFADRFEIPYNKAFKINFLLNAITEVCKANKERGKKTVIAIDEFGKFLEYAAKHQPEQELYFIQLLAELANDKRNDLLLLSTLHQDFSAYSFDLTKAQRNEWEKVKGRQKEITFNEPVEQLLFLAAERMSLRSSIDKIFDIDSLIDAITKAKAFPLRDFLNKETAQKLLPFDILSAAVLTLSLQRYGQNERSLFSFLESNDYLGINDFVSDSEPYYNIACVYDYLAHNYYSFLNSRSNPHYLEWNLLKKSIAAIENIDSFTQRQQSDAIKLIKTIGLLNVFSSPAAKINRQFLCDYSKLALGIRGTDSIIETLEKRKVIRYVNYAYKYILFEGTDIDIELAIDEAGNLIEGVTNVVHHLHQNFEFPFLLAKKNFFETGTPRFFQFRITDKLEIVTPEDEVDGFINLIFTNDISSKQIKAATENCTEAILFGYFKNTKIIQKILFEIQKVNKVIDLNPDDKVAVRELKGILQHNRNLLNHAVMDSLYNPELVDWYFQNEKLTITNRTKLTQVLSEICERIYSKTPRFRNEMVNKTKLSGQLITARRNLVAGLLERAGQENIGFNETQFPPEKTVYLSLLKETGIHAENKGLWQLGAPADKSFSYLWQLGEDFISGAKHDRRSIQDFAQMLSEKPIKLKKGFIDYWLSIFLIAKQDEFALYDEDGFYVPEITSDVLDLLVRKPSNFYIKAFNVTGINKILFSRYRNFINQSSDVIPNNKSFIETIKPFLVLYKRLNSYATSTKTITKKSVALREAISNATDPERAFFEDFPAALGYSLPQLRKEEKLAEAFISDLQKHIREIQNSYGEMLTRFEAAIKDTLGSKESFPHYRDSLKKRYGKLKTYMLNNEQKAFYSRIVSPLDDRDSYLNSFGQVCIGKSLEQMNDEDESKLHARFNDFVLGLDTLTDISKADVDDENEEVLLFQLSSFVKGWSKRTLRIPKTKQKDVDSAILKIKHILRNDTRTNLSILVKLLQQELENEK